MDYLGTTWKSSLPVFYFFSRATPLIKRISHKMPSCSRTPLIASSLVRHGLAGCAALYMLVGSGCAKLQRKLIYFPPVHDTQTVEAAASKAGLECWRTPSGQAIGWKRPSPGYPAMGRILMLHGNSSCAFESAHYADALQKAGPFEVFFLEYPGYADRLGKPGEQALYDSAQEGLAALDSTVPIYLFGESLGTAIACFLAGTYPDKIAGVVLFAPFNRLQDVAQAHALIFPASWVLTEQYPSEDYLSNYDGPVAILAAGRDWVVPERFARRLYDRYDGPKKLWRFPNANHNSVMNQSPEMWATIIEFWQSHPPSVGAQ